MGNIIKVGGYAMLTRRQFVFAAASLPGGLFALQACSSDTASQVSYAEASQRTWRHTEGAMRERSSLLHELVRYGTLAASSHNSQCWKFHVEAHAISILPDLSRRLPAVDPDDHHLYASLGCAVENLIQAALANGLKGEAGFDTSGDGSVSIALEPTQAIERHRIHRIGWLPHEPTGGIS